MAEPAAFAVGDIVNHQYRGLSEVVLIDTSRGYPVYELVPLYGWPGTEFRSSAPFLTLAAPQAPEDACEACS
jgi:hypothetical protein